MPASTHLRAIKAVHTLVWLIVVACIIAIPVFAWLEMYVQVIWLTSVVVAEIIVLVFNGWRCPLTGIAARYTDDRRENFDIYLPEWLAKHNKLIFGSLFVGGQLFVLLRWRGWIG